MTQSRPKVPNYQAVCRDCGMEWIPLYDTMTELLEKARCPECHAQNYEFEGGASIADLHDSDDFPILE